MIIKLYKSKLFTTHPAQRFADKYKVSEQIWNEIWKRYSILEYTPTELTEYFYIKVGMPIHPSVLNKWLFRSKIYSMTRGVMKDGAETLNSSFFGDLEDRVIKEITKNLKNSDASESRIMA